MKLISLLLVMALTACSQANSDAANVGSETSAKQSATEVKRDAENLGQSIANIGSGLAGSASNLNAKAFNLHNVQTLYSQHASHVQVEDAGTVIKLLADDNQSPRHQKFLVKVASGQTLLLTHNIDLASRIDPLNVGDKLEFNGEYIWNIKGGIVHWTHRDPQGHHIDGWIKHDGKTYQ